jgi:hypothetical protein
MEKPGIIWCIRPKPMWGLVPEEEEEEEEEEEVEEEKEGRGEEE